MEKKTEVGRGIEIFAGALFLFGTEELICLRKLVDNELLKRGKVVL